MSFIDLMANDRWSDMDLQNRQRSVVAGVVSEARQQELQTILLGHLAGLRSATPEELAEIELVKTTTLAAYAETIAARDHRELLDRVFAVEAANARLARAVLGPVLVEGEAADGIDQAVLDADQAERAAAQLVVDSAPLEVMQLVEQRALHRAPPQSDPAPIEETE